MDPHIYVIHLKRRTDRHELFLSNWEAAGLPTDKLHWHDAVDGRTITDFSGFKSRSKDARRAGGYGCFLSHISAIQTAIQNNHFPLLILEDDAVVTGSVDLSSILTNAPDKLLYLGGLPVEGRARVTIEGTGWQPLATNIRMYASHAYAFLSKSVASDVLTHLLKYPFSVDSSLVRYQRLHRPSVAVHTPFIFKQAQSLSDIDGVIRWTHS